MEIFQYGEPGMEIFQFDSGKILEFGTGKIFYCESSLDCC